jgi:hypothetical protein
MSSKTLSSYGLVEVASVRILDKQFQILISNTAMVQRCRCIYAFLIGDEIVRIGSSKDKLGNRLRVWQRDVSKALQGRKSSTPLHEAEGWSDILRQHQSGLVFARPGTIVTTSIGEMSAYLDEESVLIERHRPRLNRSMR